MNTDQISSERDKITKLLSSGRLNDGIRILEEQGQSFPAHIRLECQGNWHFYRRELQEAIYKYETAIELCPDYMISRYQYLVGTQEEAAGNFVDAFKRYQMAIEIEPSFFDAYVDLGGLLVKVGDFGGAATCYRDALKLVPDDVASLLNLKAMLVKLSEEDQAKWNDELLSVVRHLEQAQSKIRQANQGES